MRVGIDARLTSIGLGVGTFIQHLVEQLVSEPGLEIVWFGPSEPAPSGVGEVRDPGRPFPMLDSFRGRASVRRANIDVFHFAGNAGWNRPAAVPFVLTIHDLIYLDSGVRRRSVRQLVGHRYLRLNVPRAARRAAAIAVPSQATADDVARRLSPNVKPAVIPSGIDRVPGQGESPIKHGPYIVAFAAPDPRKGIEMVLGGWRRAGLPHRLVIFAGGGVPDGFSELMQDDVSNERIELLEYLSREDMWRVLQGASALVYPSLAEGFGMPVLEGMAAGLPVITGLSPATLELGGDAIARIDPSAPVRSIARQLRQIIEDTSYESQLVERGRARAATFSWTATARKYVDLYSAAAADTMR